MLWGISENVSARALCNCVQHPWNLTSKEFLELYERKKATFSAKMCIEKMLWGISEIVNVQHPWKLTGRDFWSSQIKRKPLSQQKCVLTNCCGKSQKWWVIELSKLCHCVQHPWKITGRDFWSSQLKRKPLSQQKMCFEKMLWVIS